MERNMNICFVSRLSKIARNRPRTWLKKVGDFWKYISKCCFTFLIAEKKSKYTYTNMHTHTHTHALSLSHTHTYTHTRLG